MQFSLFERFQYEGTWFIPENSEKRMFGILIYEPGEGLTLKLVNATDDVSDIFGSGGNYEILQGVTVNPEIKNVTLVNCKVGNARTGLGDTGSYYECNVDYALFGCLFSSTADIKFEKVGLVITSIENWHSSVVFPAKIVNNALETVGYNPITPIEVDIPTINSVIRFRSKLTENNFNPAKHLHVKHTPLLEIEPSSHKSLNWFMNKLGKLTNLFTILYGHPAHKKMIIGRVTIQYEIDKFYPEDIYIYFNNKIAKEPSLIESHNMVFTYAIIQDSYKNILNLWFKNFHFLKILLEMLLMIEYGDNKFVNFRLLALTQGLESYHRNSNVGLYVQPEEYEVFYNALLKELKTHKMSSDLKNSLKNRLKYGNEFSQRKRFQLLLKLLPKKITQKIRIDSEEINQIIEARNQYTHYANHKHYSKQKAFRYDLRLLAMWGYKLKVLSRILIYKEIGVPTTYIYNAIARIKDYKIMLNLQDAFQNRSKEDYKFLS